MGVASGVFSSVPGTQWGVAAGGKMGATQGCGQRREGPVVYHQWSSDLLARSPEVPMPACFWRQGIWDTPYPLSLSLFGARA